MYIQFIKCSQEVRINLFHYSTIDFLKNPTSKFHGSYQEMKREKYGIPGHYPHFHIDPTYQNIHGDPHIWYYPSFY
ncbi:hypothetical protein SH2C18_15130 [Clostridium sediminicola]